MTIAWLLAVLCLGIIVTATLTGHYPPRSRADWIAAGIMLVLAVVLAVVTW